MGVVLDKKNLSESQRIAHLGSWEMDLATRQITWSDEMHRIAGVPMGTLGNSFEDFLTVVHTNDRETVRKAFLDSLVDVGSPDIEYRIIRRSDAVERWCQTSFDKERGDPGQITRTVGTVLDITDRKILEVELRRTNEELEQFVYLAAHDLREPLRMLSSYLGLIEKRLGSRLEDDLKSYFGFAVGGAKRMNLMITNLLKYSLIGKSTDFSSVQLTEAVSRASLLLRPAILKSDAVLSVAPDLPVVTGVGADLEQLFQELIGNAIKYRSAGRQPMVEIGWRKQANANVVWVKDNGVGVAPEQSERAFQVLRRFGEDNSFDGSGIGLAVCRKIVESHGGRIWIESEVGAGSTFFMTFPAESQSTARP